MIMIIIKIIITIIIVITNAVIIVKTVITMRPTLKVNYPVENLEYANTPRRRPGFVGIS